MCRHDSPAHDTQLPQAAAPLDPDPNAGETFPWSSGRVYDAHCHPTDTLASLAAIPHMGAATLTVMSTRAQDQDLVAALGASQPDKVVAAFGWHPWFAHQLYDDADGHGGGGQDLSSTEAKRQHLARVLAPMPSSLASPVTAKDEQLVAALDALAVSLPAIRPLSAFLAETRQRLLDHPGALVGEIGVDKAFRVPEPAKMDRTETEAESEAGPEAGPVSGLTPGGREGRQLSPFRVRAAHQMVVLQAQLSLSANLQRPVSVHGVQAHGLLYSALAATWRGQERKTPSRRQRRQMMDAQCPDDESTSDRLTKLKEQPVAELGKDCPAPAKTYPPAICLHSFSGPVDMLQQYLRPDIPVPIYFSFSTAVNCSTASGCQRTAEVVAACPADRLLVESDLHVAGTTMDAALQDMYRRVCAIKGWTLAEGVERIARNYNAFIKTPSRGDLT
ncbi:Cut9-interacting protein scn1 [Sporothrix epigloea]|uniref:Cut9-interacting protein scn1 n=1 Tax=Sporothrix epigloea TaxID=1892477 RepID=A0ABP0DUK8_9PEZI